MVDVNYRKSQIYIIGANTDCLELRIVPLVDDVDVDVLVCMIS